MKILITGAAGFLGLHLTKALNLQNHDLTLVDIAPFNANEYPNGAKDTDKIKFITGDVRDHAMMEPLIRDTQILIHAAAALPLWPEHEIFDTNVNGTKLLLEYAERKKIEHFIHISSTAVYGVPKVHPIYEDSEMIGVGSYGESKIEAEMLCKKFRANGLPVTVFRPKTFVGTHRLGVFEILFDWIKDGKKIPVIGNGKNKYQLLDVEDLVQIIGIAVNEQDKQKINSEFNVGAAEFSTVKSDLTKLFQFAESGSSILPTPAFPVKKALWLFEKLGISPLYQWIYDTADKDSFVSIDKLVTTLGYKPLFSNADALIKSYKWYLENYDQIKAQPEGINHTSGWKQGVLKVVKKLM